MLCLSGNFEGEQFKVCAVGKGNQRVMCCSACMLATWRHRETTRCKFSHRRVQFIYQNYNMVDVHAQQYKESLRAVKPAAKLTFVCQSSSLNLGISLAINKSNGRVYVEIDWPQYRL